MTIRRLLHKGLGEIEQLPHRKLVRLFNNVQLWLSEVDGAENVRLTGRLYVWNRGNMRIGKNVSINSGPLFNPIGGDIRAVLLVGPGASLSIGDNVGISNSAIVAHRSVEIGNNVLIGGGCKIYDTDFHSLSPDDRIPGHENRQQIGLAPVRIGNGVFIGGHSVILKGVTVGEGSIIGAGSLVSRDVPENEIWGGNPAKFIRNVN